MPNAVIFWFVLLAMIAIVALLSVYSNLLNDQSSAVKPPYSFSRVQLAWWFTIVLTSFITVVIATGVIPTLHESTLILLGIGSLTSVSGKLIDISDNNAYQDAVSTPSAAPVPLLSKDQPSVNFINDILSDASGISIHRLQALIFNLVIGIWFLFQVWLHIKGIDSKSPLETISKTLPVIEPNNLVLLGVSAGTYVSLKTMENKAVKKPN
jgi:hypothetical protein